MEALELDIINKFVNTGILKKEEVLFIYDGGDNEYVDDSQLSKLKVFCFSPKITCGIDYKYEANVFSIVCNSNFGAHLTPEQIMQQITRCRKPLELNMYIRHEFDLPLYTSDFDKYNLDQFNTFVNSIDRCDIFEELCIVDKNYKYDETEDTIIYNKISFFENIQKSDFKNILLIMIKNAGYKLVEYIDVSCDRNKEIIDEKTIGEIQEILYDERVVLFDEYIFENVITNEYFKNHMDNLLNDVFKITARELKYLHEKDIKLYEYFRCLICDAKQLEQYLFLNNMMRSDEELRSRVTEKNKDDLKIIKSQSVEMMILIIKSFINKYIPDVLPDSEFSSFYYNQETYEDKKITMSKTDYEFIKMSCKSKSNKPIPTTKKQCVDFIYTILNKFMPDYIQNNSMLKTIDKKKIRVKELQLLHIDLKNNVKFISDHLQKLHSNDSVDIQADQEYEQSEFIKNYWKKIHNKDCDDFEDDEFIVNENLVNVCDILKLLIDDALK